MDSIMNLFNELSEEEQKSTYGGEKRAKYIYVDGEIVIVYIDSNKN